MTKRVHLYGNYSNEPFKNHIDGINAYHILDVFTLRISPIESEREHFNHFINQSNLVQ